MVKVAFFSSCGYTELGAMDIFLNRMNSRCQFIRCLPTRDKHKPGLAPKQSGLTGDDLIAEAIRRIKKYASQYRLYDAIIIEDDLDCRFYEKTETEILSYFQSTRASIYHALKREIPVIFLYASPEIEVWFLADWNHTFAGAYEKSIPSDCNRFFCNRLRKYIDDKILGQHKNNLETYGMLDGIYKKLSDQIATAIDAAKVSIREDANAPPDIKNQVCENKEIRYSKALHGVEMLRRADPSEISKHCKQYFVPAFIEIQNLA